MALAVGLQQYFCLRPEPIWLNDLLHLSHTRLTARLFFCVEPLGLAISRAFGLCWRGASALPF